MELRKLKNLWKKKEALLPCESDVNTMSREDFYRLPVRNWNEETFDLNSLVIIPDKITPYSVAWYYVKVVIARVLGHEKPELWTIGGLHDSGFRCMSFVAVKDGKPICRISGCSDVVHLDGIGGYGYNWHRRFGGVPTSIQPSAWSIDCLRGSGFLRIFSLNDNRKLIAGTALSSFELFTQPRDKE